MLPKPIYDEIFSLEGRVADPALDFFTEEIVNLGFETIIVANNDLAITFYAKSHDAEIEIRLDRIAKCFTISAIANGSLYFPIVGDWETIVKCIKTIAPNYVKLND